MEESSRILAFQSNGFLYGKLAYFHLIYKESIIEKRSQSDLTVEIKSRRK